MIFGEGGGVTHRIVGELPLVTVIEVNEFSGSVLLTVHPGADILRSRVRVRVHALSVPAGEGQYTLIDRAFL